MADISSRKETMTDTSCGLHVNYIPFEFDFTGFRFSDYLNGERKKLEPQLIKAGFKLLDGWFSEDWDSFGPLVRAIDVISAVGEIGRITYG